LDLRELLPPTHYLYGSEYKKAQNVMHEHHWWNKHSGKTFILPHSRSDSFVCLEKSNKNIENNCVYMKLVNMCEYKIPEKIELDYDFGYLIGAYCAEGCMTKHQISISNNDEDYLKPIERICEKLNITTKIYKVSNKIKEGWVSQDIRIYNTLLCHIIELLCGKLSHNKFVSDKIIFSNPECMMGFLDAYIGGDGCVARSSYSKNPVSIDITSVSLKLLTDVMVLLKNIGIVSTIHKPKKIESNNRGSKNIKQHYLLIIKNKQSQKLGEILNLPIKEKQQLIETLLNQKFTYEYDKSYLTIPNIVNEELLMQERGDCMCDLLFDSIVSIEEVPNTTNYAYDLTVEETRNFDIYNGICCRDTFHLAGVASKSNVTRGVPRIEEILRLTKNPKNPSLTVYLKEIDETEKDKAEVYSNMLEHTKLIDVVKSVQIYFDPIENTSFIQEDKLLMDQFYEFENLMNECTETDVQNPTQKSKWIIRMEIDAEKLLDKNITMDDIHFAITNSYSNEISCVFSDYNDANLVFRIRMNSDVFKKKTGSVEPLDQSDKIYMLKTFQDNLLNNIVLRGVSNIKNVMPRKLQNMVVKEDGKYVRKDVWILDTTGSNLLEILGSDLIDGNRTFCNDIKEIYDVLGIEAARQSIYNEFVEVMEFSDVYINYHHLSVLCDRMTMTQNMVPIFRSGILNDDIGPIAKATFEVHTEVFLNAARHADFDSMRGVSANVMCGQYGYYGTNSFNLVLDMKDMVKLQEAKIETTNVNAEIEKQFGFKEDSVECAMNDIMIRNNISAIKEENVGICNDNYDIGF
jgi:DNA-directed RNA polymerase beta' subunit